MTGTDARRTECSAPPGAVASMISFTARPKKNTMPMSLTTKRHGSTAVLYPAGEVFAQTSAMTAPSTINTEFSTANSTALRMRIALTWIVWCATPPARSVNGQDALTQSIATAKFRCG
jgi:hypothetical protein